VDPHGGGAASELRLVETFWGRMVDVHAIDGQGGVVIEPVYRDFVISQNILSDGIDFELTTNPLTQRTRLVILRERTTDGSGGEAFQELLSRASAGLPPVLPKNYDGSSAPPFSLVARNATLVLRFDDLLNDEEAVVDNLPQLVRVATGYRPTTPYTARIVFGENHGGVANGRFYPTRILVDLSVSPTEAQEGSIPVPVNPVGLPPSDRISSDPNTALRIPTLVDFGSGQFRVLTNVSGQALAPELNGPFDPFLPTRPVVRALRSGNAQDINNGFLFDLHRPELLGTFSLAVTRADEDPEGRPGFDFLLDVAFTTPCQVTPRRGDVLDLVGFQLEVTSFASTPDGLGVVRNIRASIAGRTPAPNTSMLLGSGRLVTPYFLGGGLDPACWLRFDPPAATPPSSDVGTDTRIVVRFSEPMNDLSLGAFDTFRVLRGSSLGSETLMPQDFVVGQLVRSPGREEVRFTPLLPLANRPSIDYQVQVVGGPEGVTDLAGNGLALAPPAIIFRLDPDAPAVENGSLVMRFATVDELFPLGAPDFRGQVFLDAEDGVLRPRPFSIGTAAADRGNPLPSIMTPFPPGVQTPLSPLGSKMMTGWRYADFGWLVDDETRYDLDVIGMNWSPIGGVVLGDFYQRFEMRLAHGSRVMDEAGTTGSGPLFPGTSLRDNPTPFTENILEGTPQVVVHPRSLGYLLDPASTFTNANGTALVPFPWNRGAGPRTTFTWRDTSILEQGGHGGVGVPLLREVRPPISVDKNAGSFAPPGKVPTVGLPLLWEIRCFPTSSGFGLNPFDISLVFGNFNQLKSRIFSTGGTNISGTPTQKDPDLEISPTGGFNPSSLPPGGGTPAADPVFYIGQIDIAIRVSRAHTIWLDTRLATPAHLNPVVEPTPTDQPPGTSVLLEFRGAIGFSAPNPTDPFNATLLDAYGDLPDNQVLFHGGENHWSDDVTQADGARFLQIRMSLFNNIETGQSPTLSSIGLVFRD